MASAVAIISFFFVFFCIKRKKRENKNEKHIPILSDSIMIRSRSLISVILFVNLFILICCQITNDYDEIYANEHDVLDIKYLPSVFHNDHIYLPILYKCSSLFPRRISLSITINKTSHRTNFAVFRRHWFCQKSTRIQIRYVHIRLPRSLAYQFDSFSLPIEQGQLNLIMFYNQQNNMKYILKQLQFNIRFLPVHKRPFYYSFPWNPVKQKPQEQICLIEPGEINTKIKRALHLLFNLEFQRIINYPFVLTGSAYGKHFNLPFYDNYNLRLEQENRLNRPQYDRLIFFSIKIKDA